MRRCSGKRYSFTQFTNPGESKRVINPLRVGGIEYMEYVTLAAQSFGAALERLGFAAAARHRSGERGNCRSDAKDVIFSADSSAAGSRDEDSQASRLSALAFT